MAGRPASFCIYPPIRFLSGRRPTAWCEIRHVAWGLYAAEQLTAADGSTIPADGLLEILYCDETGKATFKTDVPADSKLYVKEYTTDNHYIISDEKYPVEFSYQDQETAVVHISVNDGEPIGTRGNFPFWVSLMATGSSRNCPVRRSSFYPVRSSG